jgi:NADH dehydrogenase FAD-containing subunit
MPDQPHVVILGAGFGGIGALKSLGDASAYLFVTANLPRRVPRRSIVCCAFSLGHSQKAIRLLHIANSSGCHR